MFNKKFNWFTAFLFLSIITIIFFHRLIFGWNFIWGDFPWYYFPAKVYIFDSLRDLNLPLWDPFVRAGYPIIADVATGIFYPLNLLLLPFWSDNLEFNYWLLEIFTIFHLPLGGVFVYLLMRYFRIRGFAAFVSALVFGLSSFLIAHLGHVAVIHAAIWFPLIFLFFHRGLQNKRLSDFILSGIFLAFSFLAGHPQLGYYIAFFLFWYLFYKVLTDFPPEKHFWRFLRSLFKNGILLIFTASIAIGLAALAYFPFLEAFSGITRFASPYRFASSYSLNPNYFFLTSFFPHFFGGHSFYEPYVGLWNYTELASYFGILALVLALTAIIVLFRKKKMVKFFTVSGVLAILFAFGLYFILHPLAYYLILGFGKFRVPARFVFLYLFSFSILAGLGTQALIQERVKIKEKIISLDKKLLKYLVPLFCFWVIFTLGASFFIPPMKMLRGIMIRDYLVFTFLLFSIFILIYQWLKEKISLRVFKILIVMILVVDIFFFGFEYNNGPDPLNDYSKKNEIIEFLKKQPLDSYRIQNQGILWANLGQIHQLPFIEGYTYLLSRNYSNFTGANLGYIFGQSTLKKGNRLNLLNVRYIISKEDLSGEYQKVEGVTDLYENFDALPRTFIVHETLVIPDEKEVLAKIDASDFNPRQELILEEPLPSVLTSSEKTSQEKAEITKYLPERIEIKTELAEPGMLFLSEKYYPGWQVFVDGQRQKIYRANFLFRAVYLEPGSHTIEFIYQPKSFLIGFWVTLITVYLVIFILLLEVIIKLKKTLLLKSYE